MENLFSFLPQTSILSSQEDLEFYGSDWSKYKKAHPRCVLLPSTTEEVSQILKTCHENNLAVVPSGGRTGYAGGAIAADKEVVLNISRMNKIKNLDLLGNTLTVQAGVTTEAVHAHCAEQDLIWPIDLASKGSSHIGGNLATNAGGVHVVRYGMTRKWVLGIQAVLMDGTVLNLNGALEKNNTGYDLVQLLIGSEGTLAVITEATLKLTKKKANTSVLFCALDSLAKVLSFFSFIRKSEVDVLAYEFMSDKCLNIVENKAGLKNKLSQKTPYYALVEFESNLKESEWLTTLLESSLVKDATLATSAQDKKTLWQLRERISESLFLTAPLRKYDLSVPVQNLETFISELKNFELEAYLFGHIGDGNIHLNYLKPDSMSQNEFNKLCDTIEPSLFSLIQKHAGSVSAEHGIGLNKKHLLHYCRSEAEIELFKRIKKAFDPKGLLNPHKLI